ncbi:hypothetical protein [Leucobacter chromiiresistens]|uniref:Uncharacterized protein n=1 Tax=Leucobacter chromiiresistens TaxID=1079994 RepID=A0A1H1B7D0_9MICO|nr:hypothetical protein [Leucobacter chromiiresistens]SDQ04988.1 hypothetical protein SAMN04488565_0031 [Leucobacter chromiiresistens]SDQ47865.1 hypothetical protein SAMN04488565_2633 [Leucobacter chromiiresistens]
MSVALGSPAAWVRNLLGVDPAGAPESTTVTGLRSPLGDTITATVFDTPALSDGHDNARLELAELERGDNDADLGIVVSPAGLTGIDETAPEAWNVTMTLPTLRRILGQDTHNEKE